MLTQALSMAAAKANITEANVFPKGMQCRNISDLYSRKEIDDLVNELRARWDKCFEKTTEREADEAGR